MTVRTRRRGPNWRLVLILLGIAAILFLIGAFPFLRPAIVRMQAGDGVAVAKAWTPLTGTQRVGNPTVEMLEDGTVQVITRFRGDEPIDQQDLSLYCRVLTIPATWALDSCDVDSEDARSYVVVLTR